jgi:uncharacterized membrane protein (DUF485 family)
MQQYYQQIHDDPRFHDLERKRGIFSWSLALIILICYFSFIIIIAFFPHLFAQTISHGSSITWGIPIGLFVIIISFLLTGIYVYRANREFDSTVKKIIDSHINDKHE